MSAGDEILQKVSGVCQRVKQALSCFEEGEIPEDLDSLIFIVEKLHRLLLALDLGGVYPRNGTKRNGVSKTLNRLVKLGGRG